MGHHRGDPCARRLEERERQVRFLRSLAFGHTTERHLGRELINEYRCRIEKELAQLEKTTQERVLRVAAASQPLTLFSRR
ncbi:hypothetical protein [Methylibium sp. T29-B]|uniref:hypothetical protein n=1 Tax=Methylibium sp. T29-B TaxID=1437443 RepID=UPI0038F71445